MRLAKFLELVVIKTRDIRSEHLESTIVAQADILHKLVPCLIQNLTLDGQNSTSTSQRMLFNLARQSTMKIISSFQSQRSSSNQDFHGAGYFINKIDDIVKVLNEDWNGEEVTMNDRFAKLQKLTEEAMKFSLTVDNLMTNNSDIMTSCKHIVGELESLKAEILNEPVNSDSVVLAKEVVADFVEMLEQSVNTALLTLIAETFAAVHAPLDAFILHSTLPESPEKAKFLEDLDNQTDLILNIGHLATLCTPDKKRSQKIRSCLHMLEMVEKEIVPATFEMANSHQNQSVTSREAKNHLRLVRKLWKDQVEELEDSLKEIVDPTAFCVVVESLISSLCSKLKASMYSQNVDFLKVSLLKLVKLSQSCVDFAWQTEDRTSDAIQDDHPIIKV